MCEINITYAKHKASRTTKPHPDTYTQKERDLVLVIYAAAHLKSYTDNPG